MQHKCKVTVIDKKVYPELQRQYCADPEVGACSCYQVGDEYVFERYAGADHFWREGIGTLVQGDQTDATAGSAVRPHCSEAWDAISRYIYTALQGGSIMRRWMNDDRIMIACCSDGTRPVIFKIERLDYKALYIDGIGCEKCEEKIREALTAIPDVKSVEFRRDKGFAEVFLEKDVPDEALKAAVEGCGSCQVTKID